MQLNRTCLHAYTSTDTLETRVRRGTENRPAALGLCVEGAAGRCLVLILPSHHAFSRAWRVVARALHLADRLRPVAASADSRPGLLPRAREAAVGLVLELVL